jgi:diacylglycerol kinase (ATP)
VRRAVLIYNPAAGKGRHERMLPGLLAVLGDGLAIEAAPTRGPGDAGRIAREAADDGAEVVLALGGDGTVRETCAGLLEAERGGEVALGVLPGGTTNVLAQALGLPALPLDAARLLSRLDPRPLDVGRCGATPFLMMASSGLDAVALQSVDAGLKSTLGPAGVLLSSLRTWWSYEYPALRVLADGVALEATFAVVTNIPLYGGPYRLAPDARHDDGLLHLVLFSGGRLETLGFAMDVLRGGHVHRGDVTVRVVREAVFEGPGCLQVDGDLCAEKLPARVTVDPARLRVLSP